MGCGSSHQLKDDIIQGSPIRGVPENHNRGMSVDKIRIVRQNNNDSQGDKGRRADLRNESDLENWVEQWLDGISDGFGGRFGAAFAAHGYRTKDEIYSAPPLMEDVAFILEETDASLTEAAAVMQILADMFANTEPFILEEGGGPAAPGGSRDGTIVTIDRKENIEIHSQSYNSYYKNRMLDIGGDTGLSDVTESNRSGGEEGAAVLSTPTPPHSPEPRFDANLQETDHAREKQWQEADQHFLQENNTRTSGGEHNTDANAAGGGGGYDNIEENPMAAMQEPKPEPEPYINPDLIRGICGMCNKPVLVTHVRNKNSAGVYFHGNLDECVVANDLE